jgi:sarcosine/dimethylglycine N-methyltransferase
MSDLLEHYDRTSLASELDAMLAAAFPGDRRLTPAELAPLDQFHSRGILATAELAELARIERATRVLDVGSRASADRLASLRRTTAAMSPESI